MRRGATSGGRAAAGRLVGALGVAAVLAAAPAGPAAAAGGPSEYEVKAAFIYNFAKFVAWPGTAFARPGDPFVIGVLGEDPFGAAWGLLSGKSIEGHPVVISRSVDLTDPPPPHIVFIASSERGRLGGILDSLSGRPVLTVGDSPGFAAAGVMLNLYVSGGRVAFEVNQAAAGDTALKISSRLLSLGRPAPGSD